jgi:hypothetical protein
VPDALQRDRHAGDRGVTGFTAAGLPLAMQIAGRAFAEPMVYRIAQAYCDATRFYERRPPVIAQAEASLV